MAFFCGQLTGFLDFVTQTAYQVLIWVFQFRVCFLKPEIFSDVNFEFLTYIDDILSHFPDFWRQKQSIYVGHDGINKKLRLNFENIW